jgi:beta-RFAP synthase
MPREIVVSTGARLHFGLFAHGGVRRRQFGGIGVMVDQPGFVVSAGPAPDDELHCGLWQGRVEELLLRLRTSRPDGSTSWPMRLEIVRSPAPHMGLGSGTQLAMAVAKICSIMDCEIEAPAVELARRAARGLRSAVGIYGFQHGGLLVEGGKCAPDEISPLVARVDFPDEWRFVLARPRGTAGLSGTDESNGFARLGPMPQTLTNRLCGIALTEILPSAIERDFAGASDAIGRFGRLVGEYFAPVQGGVFAHDQMRRLAERLSLRGIRGVGQTSWGPTLFILCPGASFARDLADELTHDPPGGDCEFTIVAPLNRGAAVQ